MPSCSRSLAQTDCPMIPSGTPSVVTLKVECTLPRGGGATPTFICYNLFKRAISNLKSKMTLEAISLPPASGQSPTYLLVTLHGWGADARDLAPLAPAFNLPDWQFLFPNAPFPHPQVPWGKAWYDLETSQYQGLPASRQLLHDWLLSLEAQTGVPLSRTALCGFSQGGAMALDVGLSLPLAGLCSLSGYLHAKPQLTASPLPPVLIAHGKQDPVVPLQAAQQAREELAASGVTVQYHEFEMGHEILPEEIGIVRNFLTAHLN